MLEKLIESLLDDDEGISAEAYGALLDYLASIDRMELLTRVNNRVDATDGRYYFSSLVNNIAEGYEETSYVWKDPDDPKNW